MQLLAQASSDNEPEATTAVLPPSTYHDYTANTTTHVPPEHIAYYHDNEAHPHSHVRYQRHIPRLPPAVIGDELSDAQTPSDSEQETDSDETLANRPVIPQRAPPPTSLPASRGFSLRDLHPLAILRFLCGIIPMPPPPLLASLLALVCTIPVLQTFLKSSAMVSVRGALESAGGCSVPLTLVVLGGWFWEDDDNCEKNKCAESRADAVRKGKGSKNASQVTINGVIEDMNGSGSGSVSRRRSLTQEDLEQEAARAAGVSRSPSLTSLFSTLHDIWKLRHVKQRRKGPIHLPDDEDIEQRGDVDVEAGGLSSSVSSLRDRQKMKQAGVDVNSIEGADEPQQNANQIPEGETLTVVLTLVARMVIVPLLVLPMIAYIKVRSEGDEGAIQVFDE